MGVVHCVNGSKECTSACRLWDCKKSWNWSFCWWIAWRASSKVRSLGCCPEGEEASNKPDSSNVSLRAVMAKDGSCFLSKFPPGKTFQMRRDELIV